MKLEIRNRKSETEKWKPKSGNRKVESEKWNLKIDQEKNLSGI
jgi:hypothetical protein